jgi:hypothetical protein
VGTGRVVARQSLPPNSGTTMCRQDKEDGEEYKSSQNKVKFIFEEMMRKLKKCHELQVWNIKN